MSDGHPPRSVPAESPAPADPGRGTGRPQVAATARGRSELLRMVLITCGLLCMLAGPTSCYSSISISFTAATNGEDSAPDPELLLAIGVAASVGVPVIMAAVAALSRDFKAAGCSAALLAWPIVVTAVILLGGSISGG